MAARRQRPPRLRGGSPRSGEARHREQGAVRAAPRALEDPTAPPPSPPPRAVVAAEGELRSGGDRERCFAVLYPYYSSLVLAYLRRRGVPPAQAEELNQQVWMRIHTGLKGFRWECPFGAWVFQVAQRARLQSDRGERAVKRSGETIPWAAAESEAAVAVSPVAEVEAQRRERLALLMREIRRLPDQMRRCLVLSILQERSEREIATLLGVSVGTVKAHLFQARRRLKSRLAPVPAGLHREPPPSDVPAT